MRRALAGFCWLAFSLCALVAAHAQQAVKGGLIMTYSGQFADAAAQMDNGVKLYMKQHGDTVAGRKIEIIRPDTRGTPDRANTPAPESIFPPSFSVPRTRTRRQSSYSFPAAHSRPHWRRLWSSAASIRRKSSSWDKARSPRSPRWREWATPG